jgi:uncharacterized protein YndB with AHSA1/START domain
MTRRIESTVTINAPPTAVWSALARPDLMKQWMGEPEMQIEVITDWKVGGPIVVKGFHHTQFDNKGTVLRFEPDSVLRYSHLSSLSRLPDRPENYSVMEFRVEPSGDQTLLTLVVSNFPTETIFKHLEFYWNVTIGIMKKFIEERHENDDLIYDET